MLDAVESSEADIQEDIEFALIQMKSETLNKINDALGAARAGQLRQLLRVRRGNRREAAARAAVRGPLQGLRGGARDRRAARASAGAAARRVVAVPATCKLVRRPADCRLRRWRSPLPPHRPSSLRPHHRLGARLKEVAMSDQDRDPRIRGRLDRRSAALDSARAADPAAARHGAVSELVHAARGRARELRPPDRRGDRERQADRASSRSATRRSRSRTQDDLYPVGTATHIHKMFKLPDGSLRLIVQGLARLTLDEVVVDAAVPARAGQRRAPRTLQRRRSARDRRAARNIKTNFQQVVSLSPLLSDDLQTLADEHHRAGPARRLHRLEPVARSARR